MNYRERSAWICLLSILAVQGPYFGWSTPLFLSLATLPVFVVAMKFESTIGVAALIQLVLAGWVLAELVRYGSQCRDYRRSVAGLGDLGA